VEKGEGKENEKGREREGEGRGEGCVTTLGDGHHWRSVC